MDERESVLKPKPKLAPVNMGWWYGSHYTASVRYDRARLSHSILPDPACYLNSTHIVSLDLAFALGYAIDPLHSQTLDDHLLVK